MPSFFYLKLGCFSPVEVLIGVHAQPHPGLETLLRFWKKYLVDTHIFHKEPLSTSLFRYNIFSLYFWTQPLCLDQTSLFSSHSWTKSLTLREYHSYLLNMPFLLDFACVMLRKKNLTWEFHVNIFLLWFHQIWWGWSMTPMFFTNYQS